MHHGCRRPHAVSPTFEREIFIGSMVVLVKIGVGNENRGNPKRLGEDSVRRAPAEVWVENGLRIPRRADRGGDLGYEGMVQRRA